MALYGYRRPKSSNNQMSWTGVSRNLDVSNLLNREDQCTRYLSNLKWKFLQIFLVRITIALWLCGGGGGGGALEHQRSIYFVSLLGFSNNCKIQQSGRKITNMGSPLSDQLLHRIRKIRHFHIIPYLLKANRKIHLRADSMQYILGKLTK